MPGVLPKTTYKILQKHMQNNTKKAITKFTKQNNPTTK